MIIAFFGPDGTGKTTIARMVIRYLSSKRIRASYVRFKSHHLAMYLILRFLQKLGLIPITNSPRILDYSLKKYFGRSRLYPYLELMNAVLWLFINIRIRKEFGVEVIVADRYIPDFLVSMLIIAPNRSIFNYLSKVLRPFMHNTLKVFLYANIDDILNRKRDELLSYKYVSTLLRLYIHVVRIIGVDLYVNTSRRGKAETFHIIKEFICNKVNRR